MKFDTEKWLKLLATAAFVVTSAIAFTAVAGCDDDDDLDDAADNVGDAADDAADDLEDAVD